MKGVYPYDVLGRVHIGIHCIYTIIIVKQIYSRVCTHGEVVNITWVKLSRFLLSSTYNDVCVQAIPTYRVYRLYDNTVPFLC